MFYVWLVVKYIFELIFCLTPVSYTHLRAHETVLDLVCRLLLEKKKQNISNNDVSIQKYYKTLTSI